MEKQDFELTRNSDYPSSGLAILRGKIKIHMNRRILLDIAF